MQKINIIVILLLIAVYPFNLAPIITHANIAHLLCNIITLYLIVHDSYVNKWLVYPIILILGWIALLGSGAVGFSAPLMVMAGINAICAYTHKRMLYILAFFCVSYFIPSIAWAVHALAFGLGVVVGLLTMWWKGWYENR